MKKAPPEFLAQQKRFTSTYQPKKHTGYRLTTILEKFLKTPVKSADPEVLEALKSTKLKSTKGAALMLRYIYNGLEGETKAIEGILNRIDGKVKEEISIEQPDRELIESELEILPLGTKSKNRIQKYLQ